ncbi:MAG: hypothetical protein OEY18_08345, partial [Candidatus Aminicenantes bacterium]|nr:hypothetical protein [Candidatus Aminicenantes bacterium]
WISLLSLLTLPVFHSHPKICTNLSPILGMNIFLSDTLKVLARLRDSQSLMDEFLRQNFYHETLAIPKKAPLLPD